MSRFGVEALPETSVAMPLRLGRIPGGYRPDLLVCASGYEARSRHVPSLLMRSSSEVVVSGFDSHFVIDAQKNASFFEEAGLEVPLLSDSDYPEWVRTSMRGLRERFPAEGPLLVSVDISSLPRNRIAALVEEIPSAVGILGDVVIDLLYAPPRFAPHDPSAEEPLAVAGPVTPEFAGWYSRVELPLALVLGLGYEPGKASAGIELIEPSSVYAFIPRGFPDSGNKSSEYDHAVIEANSRLLEGAGVTPVQFEVAHPYALFSELYALVAALEDFSRPVLLPLGPKIFAVACLLAAREIGTEIAVWRLSPGQFAEPKQAFADGPVVGLRLASRPQSSTREAAGRRRP